MHIVCVGGGPAGLYLAILMKLADPQHQIEVYERNPRNRTEGWGVVFWDDLVDDLRRTDPETARRVTESAYRWSGQNLVLSGEAVCHEGGGYGIARSTLLAILVDRATGLGVDVRPSHAIADMAGLEHVDVIVAGDGVNSTVREQRADTFGTKAIVGKNKYVWLGTDKTFDAFTFAFEKTDAGWIWFHAYAFDANSSTCIIECPQQTWQRLGLDTLSASDSLTVLETVFRKPLDGCRLMTLSRDGDPLPWLNFRHLTNRRWSAGNTVLVGDAAHTTHFSIGSGTRLALQDAISLSHALRRGGATQAAFSAYEKSRRAAVAAAQHDARASAAWFEQVDRYSDLPGPTLFALLRARRDPLLPHVPPRLYYRAYAAVERTPLLRSLKRQLGPKVRTLYSRAAQPSP